MALAWPWLLVPGKNLLISSYFIGCEGIGSSAHSSIGLWGCQSQFRPPVRLSTTVQMHCPGRRTYLEVLSSEHKKRNDWVSRSASTSLYMLTEAEKFVRSDILVCGYTVHRRGRDRQDEGVILIVWDNIPTTRREDLQIGCELLWVELTLAPSNLLVGAYYNPPQSNCGSLSHLRSSLATTQIFPSSACWGLLLIQYWLGQW